MGCFRWILNSILGTFIFLFLLGNWSGVYALSDPPFWIGTSYISQIETELDTPVDKVFIHEGDQLKVITKESDVPVFIPFDDNIKPSKIEHFALLYTDFVQVGLTMTIAAWITLLAGKLALNIVGWFF